MDSNSKIIVKISNRILNNTVQIRVRDKDSYIKHDRIVVKLLNCSGLSGLKSY